ncbi:MAG: VOC family protein, partial [Anaerolineales bacterium]
MFQSLDFVYLPAPDFDSALEHYTRVLGAEVLWKVRGMGTIVAALRISPNGPALLLSEHLKGDVPILVYRVASYEESL